MQAGSKRETSFEKEDVHQIKCLCLLENLGDIQPQGVVRPVQGTLRSSITFILLEAK